MKLSILMPVYNELPSIDVVIANVRAVTLDQIIKEIIIVDDCSTDGTREYLEKLSSKPWQDDGADLRVIFQPKNEGKGSAISRAMQEATGDIIVIQDADLEYDPGEYPKLLDPILRGVADVVYGSRFLGGPHRVVYFWHYCGNKLLTLLSNMFTNLNLTDMETCYKVFRLEVSQSLTIKQKRFGFEPEFTAKIARKGWRIYEVPIAYYGRTYAEGKKIGWKDGFKALWCILRYNLYP